ncbi:MFS transporter [Bergeriella denitrificans]|uniref:Multidrug resistance translocase n=1 Tax=Bergeriella denitrificans TaxID=494 RepID=A0A378UEN1_BERDE|nr:MFS transporter [Bergeriella denitrificans]STZ75806.1 multidrug resistance translocase [Bergeriella denitrificans]
MNHQQTEFVGNDRLLFGMVLGVLTFWLFYQAVFNVAPDIQRTLAMPDTSLNAVISLGSLFSGCFILLTGGLADKFGRVRLAYIGFVLNIIACLLLYFSQGVVSFGLGRVFQGLSAACIMPSTLSIIKNYYHGAARQRAFSFWSIGSFGGSGLSSFAGGTIATYLGWQSIFLLSIAISVIGMLMIRGTPESKSAASSGSRYDYIGLFSCVLGLLALNLLITKGFRLGLGHPFTLSMLAGFIVMALIFFRTEFGLKTEAFLDFSLFANRGYSGACLSNFLINCTAGTIFIINTYLQKGHGLTPFEAGVKSLGYLATVLLMIRVSEKLLQKFGYKKPMMAGVLITALGIFGLSWTAVPHETYMVQVVASFALFGFGLGCYATPSTDCAMVNAPMEKAGVAAGVYKMASALGASFGIATGATVFSALQGAGVHQAAQTALWVMLALALLSCLSIALLVPNRRAAD